jgi:peptide-methionine (R)-S-oxide reductase
MEKTPEVTSLFSFAYVLQQWKEESLSRLTTEEAAVIWDKETEGRNAGLTHHIAKSGHYACKVCRSPLFSWSSKFNSGCGWPAFDKFYQGAVNTITGTLILSASALLTRHPDLSIADMPRIEIVCAKCEGHLGHVFHGEKFTDSDERHCVNSISIVYVNEPCALPEQNVDPEKRSLL